MLASVATFAVDGIESREVTVEVDLRAGLPAFTIVGLPDTAVRESRERVRAALLNSGLEFPARRVTANLAPADVPKSGPAFDLALAVGLLCASGQVPAEAIDSLAVVGELSLGGSVRAVRGVLTLAIGARDARYRRLMVPSVCAGEAALVEGVDVIGVRSLREIVDVLHGRVRVPATLPSRASTASWSGPDLRDVRGQEDARRALEIAAAGGHSALLVGPPGAGKTMLARRLPGILPPPTRAEAIEITRIQSVAGLARGGLVSERPFRAPHHSISTPGLVGGGTRPRPGEATLAHLGVLFLDEIGEFARHALEALRQPLEEGRVVVTRAQRTLVFPSRFMLLAACNPCPCARPADACTCDERDRGRYARRLSGALLDRIDLVCELRAAAPDVVSQVEGGEPSEPVRERVERARELQRRRLAGGRAECNAALDGAEARRLAALSGAARRRLAEGTASLALSGRGHDRVLRVARTIADLAGHDSILPSHVDEALGYRAPATLGAVA